MIIEIKDYNRINENLVILKQNSSYWYLQAKIPSELGIKDNRIRISTGFKIGTADDYFNAVNFGKNYIDKQKYLYAEGIILHEIRPTVKSVALKTIEQIKNKKIKRQTHKGYIKVLETEIIEQLGDIEFKNLGTLDIKNYFKALNSSSKTFVTTRKSCFRKMYEYAADHKIVRLGDIPNLKSLEVEVSDTEETVIFRDSDFDLIESVQSSFIASSPSITTKENRLLFRFYWNFLKQTGIRTGLETNIKWKDLYLSKAKNEERVVIHISNGKMAKKKKTRDIAVDQETIELLINLLFLQTSKSLNPPFGAIMDHDIIFMLIKKLKIENKYIFQRQDGKLPRFIDCFNQLKGFLDNRISDKNLTLYSFRHYFITECLLNEVDIYQLSKYVGNSVDVIEKTYSKVTSLLSSEYVKKNLNLDKFLSLG
jgi:integrase